ncbi:hypothetical protein BpHYR1_019494 [Brachionus plicatilis]|uniref:Uncharacterized protein n=1 Tax=Brachionus plicatilis TaxID=10195 RepID=A0A3M7S190_BRAPC|nr:hypothetical protein BpHYR1_019494 [Brachionus plicatilis]
MKSLFFCSFAMCMHKIMRDLILCPIPIRFEHTTSQIFIHTVPVANSANNQLNWSQKIKFSSSPVPAQAPIPSPIPVAKPVKVTQPVSTPRPKPTKPAPVAKPVPSPQSQSTINKNSC